MVNIKKDTEMIVHSFDGDIVVYALSDVYYGALEHNEAGWDAVCKEILDQPNAYVVLGGDLINNATRSSVSNVFEDTVRPREQKIRMTQMLEPLVPRILCIVPGNHEARSVKDADDEPTYDIACKLNVEELYRPNVAFLSISVGDSHNAYHIAVTHGAGGGIYTGATVNRNERFGNVIDGLDCLIVGHTHKGTVTRPSKLVIDSRNKVVVQREYLVVSMVSWMEYGGYAMSKMLLPSSHSNPQKLVIRNDPGHKRPKRKSRWFGEVKQSIIKRVCENPECGKVFYTPFHRKVFCCEACRYAVKKSAKLPIVEEPPRTSKLDEMSPNDLLYYGKIQAQKTLEEMQKQKERKRGKEK